MVIRLRCLAAVVIVLMVGSGCSSSSHSSSSSTTTRASSAPSGATTTTPAASTSTTTTSTTLPRGGTFTVTDGDNGQLFPAGAGAVVTVVLKSTYWSAPVSSDDHVAHRTSVVTTPAIGGCVPGAGCGTVTATFTMGVAGAVVLSSDRASCGEAMRCRPDQSHWQVTISISVPH